MSELRCYRCWFADGSARLVDQIGHREAAEEAMELAQLANAPAPKRQDKEGWSRYLSACRVVRTECLTDGTVKKWKH